MTGFRASVAGLAAVSLLFTGCRTADPVDPAGPATAAAPASAAPAPNGIEALTAEQIMDRARQALADAPSFRFSGYQMHGEARPFAEFTAVGDDLVGMMRLASEPDLKNVTMEILLAGGVQYIKPSEDYWRTLADGYDPEAAIAASRDKWIRVPASARTFGAIFARDRLVADFDVPAGTVAKGAPSEVDGVPVLTMGSAEIGGMNARVATTGEPYPLRWDTWAGDDVELTGIGATYPPIEKPAADRVTDMLTVMRSARAGKA
ncbi:hypothetical protein AMIS_29380 [Actinoplanes missouriensis 431]|uniref:Lipoprotein n=1 Tax=Actinoplanes missouriensis (strain ATCC 14538 / DSM 43046 / CBS 188.64 / JCM 3121 / NBRC 102363 / NCIMB 12654 / NRRL B-3342 / UNCC 431) TaxID=512565 RepID=I0H571_ACTM4|nr:hypothetical protein [Actinoplanes missouriensis]BAL88158.1 hypothetical protein AMIS_29380 [Actinoplanes missouriensis 431]